MTVRYCFGRLRCCLTQGHGTRAIMHDPFFATPAQPEANIVGQMQVLITTHQIFRANYLLAGRHHHGIMCTLLGWSDAKSG